MLCHQLIQVIGNKVILGLHYFADRFNVIIHLRSHDQMPLFQEKFNQIAHHAKLREMRQCPKEGFMGINLQPKETGNCLSQALFNVATFPVDKCFVYWE